MTLSFSHNDDNTTSNDTTDTTDNDGDDDTVPDQTIGSQLYRVNIEGRDDIEPIDSLYVFAKVWMKKETFPSLVVRNRVRFASLTHYREVRSPNNQMILPVVVRCESEVLSFIVYFGSLSVRRTTPWLPLSSRYECGSCESLYRCFESAIQNWKMAVFVLVENHFSRSTVFHPVGSTLQNHIQALDRSVLRILIRRRIYGWNSAQRSWMAAVFMASHAHDVRHGRNDWSGFRHQKTWGLYQYQGKSLKN